MEVSTLMNYDDEIVEGDVNGNGELSLVLGLDEGEFDQSTDCGCDESGHSIGGVSTSTSTIHGNGTTHAEFSIKVTPEELQIFKIIQLKKLICPKHFIFQCCCKDTNLIDPRYYYLALSPVSLLRHNNNVYDAGCGNGKQIVVGDVEDCVD
ncbi:unnamed protein product [Ambrosiozyma monospora]|uniref:Unnamed protein product n=1 Tax=Ambrosiozyma monospora TaxID=43982 RepID=A0A9W6T8A8_AMBMO|nr:unnamed protein product [Ambrosiozyma monospora]